MCSNNAQIVDIMPKMQSCSKVLKRFLSDFQPNFKLAPNFVNVFFGNFAKSCGRLQLRKKQIGVIDLVLVLRTHYAKSKGAYKSL